MGKILEISNHVTKSIEKKLLKIEFWSFVSFFVIGIICQLADKNCNGIIEAKLAFFNNYGMEKLLEVVERYAVIVGGASFFFQKWTEIDTQNIIYILILVFTMFVSRIFFVCSLEIISFSITTFNIIAMLLFMFCLVLYCFIHSKVQNKSYAGKETKLK